VTVGWLELRPPNAATIRNDHADAEEGGTRKGMTNIRFIAGQDARRCEGHLSAPFSRAKSCRPRQAHAGSAATHQRLDDQEALHARRPPALTRASRERLRVRRSQPVDHGDARRVHPQSDDRLRSRSTLKSRVAEDCDQDESATHRERRTSSLLAVEELDERSRPKARRLADNEASSPARARDA